MLFSQSIITGIVTPRIKSDVTMIHTHLQTQSKATKKKRRFITLSLYRSREYISDNKLIIRWYVKAYHWENVKALSKASKCWSEARASATLCKAWTLETADFKTQSVRISTVPIAPAKLKVEMVRWDGIAGEWKEERLREKFETPPINELWWWMKLW